MLSASIGPPTSCYDRLTVGIDGIFCAVVGGVGVDEEVCPLVIHIHRWNDLFLSAAPTWEFVECNAVKRELAGVHGGSEDGSGEAQRVAVAGSTFTGTT